MHYCRYTSTCSLLSDDLELRIHTLNLNTKFSTVFCRRFYLKYYFCQFLRYVFQFKRNSCITSHTNMDFLGILSKEPALYLNRFLNYEIVGVTQPFWAFSHLGEVGKCVQQCWKLFLHPSISFKKSVFLI